MRKALAWKACIRLVKIWKSNSISREDDYKEPIPTALVRIATAETASIFGKIRAPLKLRMPKKILPKVVLPTVQKLTRIYWWM
jgi:hypothetical protein